LISSISIYRSAVSLTQNYCLASLVC
jgi:hypothetical protein